jgi:hypothetical protein
MNWYTALQALTKAEENLRGEGVALANGAEVLNVVKRSPLGKALGTDLMFFDLREAVKAYEKRGKAA